MKSLFAVNVCFHFELIHIHIFVVFKFGAAQSLMQL